MPGYESERFPGAGAYGEVWVARDRNTGRRVAIKFYTHRGGLDWSLLVARGRKAGVPVRRSLRRAVDRRGLGGRSSLLHHGVPGTRSLAERLKEGPLPVAEAIHLFREIAIGLVHAHGKGVLHCDLKPANVLLDQDNSPAAGGFRPVAHVQRTASRRWARCSTWRPNKPI